MAKIQDDSLRSDFKSGSALQAMNDEHTTSATFIYQVYPRTFYDSDGDGHGDLRGVTEKLPYIKSLHADHIWLSPFYDSPDGPKGDGGYAVNDYRSVGAKFGKMEDFEELVEEARKQDIGVIIDYVICHTSDEHEWFAASRDPSHPDHEQYKDFYVWHNGHVGGDGNRYAPNNWQSVFGGSAWSWDDKRNAFYLHHFAVSQPHLNLNREEVQDAQLENMEFWLKKGVSGIRVDALSFANYDPSLRDNPVMDGRDGGRWDGQFFKYSICQDSTVDLAARIRDLLDGYSQGGRTKLSLGEVLAGRDGGGNSVRYASKLTGDSCRLISRLMTSEQYEYLRQRTGPPGLDWLKDNNAPKHNTLGVKTKEDAVVLMKSTLKNIGYLPKDTELSGNIDIDTQNMLARFIGDIQGRLGKYYEDVRVDDDIPIDGIFGPNTRTAFENSQKHLGLIKKLENRKLFKAFTRMLPALDYMYQTMGPNLLHHSYTNAMMGVRSYPQQSDINGLLSYIEDYFPDGGHCTTISNHDMRRVYSRMTDGLKHLSEEQQDLAARQVELLFMCFPGSYCMYQGEELGLEHAEPHEIPAHKNKDPGAHTEEAREGARTLIPWQHDELNAGASAHHDPELPALTSHYPKAVDLQDGDSHSWLNYIRDVIEWRKHQPALENGNAVICNTHPPLCAFIRENGDQAMLCLFNMGDNLIEFIPSDFDNMSDEMCRKIGVEKGKKYQLGAFGSMFVGDVPVLTKQNNPSVKLKISPVVR